MSDEPLNLPSTDLNSEPSSLTRTSNLLPPELVIDIVKHASSSQKNDGDRRKTLRALCLTSRRLRSIALPLLLSRIDLRPSESLEQLIKNNSPDAISMIQTIVAMNSHRDYKKSVLTKLARTATSLETLSYHGSSGSRLDLRPILGLLGCNIKFLALFNVCLSAQSTSCFRFPQVQVMQLVQCYFDGEIRFDLPSLRHLVYRRTNSTHAANEVLFLDQVATSLFSLYHTAPPNPPLPDSIVNNHSIARCHFAEISMPPPLPSLTRFAHVLHFKTAGLASASDRSPYVINRIESWIEVLNKFKPEAILLDQVELDPVYRESFGKLQDFCQRRGIEMVWEEPEPRSINPTFTFGSPWFIKWSEERRRRQLDLDTE